MIDSPNDCLFNRMIDALLLGPLYPLVQLVAVGGTFALALWGFHLIGWLP